MQLNTKHFGLIDIEEAGIINFPGGLPGFEDVKKYVLLGNSEEGSPFHWLQGVDNAELAFVVIDPKTFLPDYVVDVDDAEVEELNINDVDKILVFSIVVVPDNITNITANLKAPILINTQNNKGKQVVMEKNNYEIRHYIVEELRKMGGRK
jgi:flagellar assembly factor FliW